MRLDSTLRLGAAGWPIADQILWEGVIYVKISQTHDVKMGPALTTTY